jgi:hypothetical protein
MTLLQTNRLLVDAQNSRLSRMTRTCGVPGPGHGKGNALRALKICSRDGLCLAVTWFWDLSFWPLWQSRRVVFNLGYAKTSYMKQIETQK